MTNSEKYKTAGERRSAYTKYCSMCYIENLPIQDEFVWLDLEYKDVLKPCPFCGSSASLKSGTVDHWILCSNKDCAAALVARSFSSADEAIAAWNRRA